MKLSAYASEPHYLDHLAGVWRALAPDERGGFYTAPRLLPRAAQVGVSGAQVHGAPPTTGPALVASQSDIEWLWHAGHRGPIVFLEHGAGQTYRGDPAMAKIDGYPGCAGRDRVSLFLCPGEHVVDAWRAAYPSTPAVAVGCPKLDRLRDLAPKHRGPDDPYVVAVTWHWDNTKLGNEARSAWAHYSQALGALRTEVEGSGAWLIGHSHPRARNLVTRAYARHGIDMTDDASDVLLGADLLIADNTSLAYEFAALDKPVLSLNAPWYRRDVAHGLRFWSHVPGLQCDEPAQLTAALQLAISDPTAAQAARRRAVEHVYAHRDGHAGERAVTAIREVLDG